MELFQILDCSSLGTCCSDYGLMSILDITRKIFDLIQLIVPIILITMLTIQFVQLSINPELKGGFRRILNKFIAVVIIFLLPVLIDAVLGLVPDTFSVAACWENAKVSNEISRTTGGRYIPIDDENRTWTQLVDAKVARSRNNTRTTTTSSGSSYEASRGGSARGRAIVAYANQFVGQTYRFGGRWNGELPYTPTDCSGFVSGVYKHFGIDLIPQTESMWNDTSKYTVVTSGPLKAGDLVMYYGHVAMITGNGNEIIHAKCTKCGIVKDSSFSTGSGFRGIMRINGVN